MYFTRDENTVFSFFNDRQRQWGEWNGEKNITDRKLCFSFQNSSFSFYKLLEFIIF